MNRKRCSLCAARAARPRAMPSLKYKYKTFHDFAQASLEDIYTNKCLQESHRFSRHGTRQSGVLINDGAARFQFQPLPALVQVSPGFGRGYFPMWMATERCRSLSRCRISLLPQLGNRSHGRGREFIAPRRRRWQLCADLA